VRREKVVVKEEATNATFFDFAFELNGFGSRVERKGMEDAPRNTGIPDLVDLDLPELCCERRVNKC
jgi:hypothetical protein